MKRPSFKFDEGRSSRSRAADDRIWREEHEQTKQDQAKIRAKNDGALFYDTPPAMREWGKTLNVSHPEEPAEKQADQIAKQVMNDQPVSEITSQTPGNIQAKQNGSVPVVRPEFESKLNSSKNGGANMPENLRGEMEGKMDADFSGVKLHTDSRANEMTQEMNAKAFTHGQDIYFRKGKDDFGSEENKELLAHELVHAASHNKTSVSRKIWRQEDPSKKSNFIQYSTPKKVVVIAYATGLLFSDSPDSAYEAILHQGYELLVEWESRDGLWLFVRYGEKSGYILRDNVADSIDLPEYVVHAEFFKGDLNQVAKNINAALTTYNFWGNIEEGDLLKAIPDNLSPDQKTQLSTIYFELYKEDLFTRIAKELTPSLGILGEKEAAVKAFNRLSRIQDDKGYTISLSVVDRKIGTGSDVTCTFEGPHPVKQKYVNRYGQEYTTEADRYSFVPRVDAWMVYTPSGGTLYHWTKDATEWKYTFTPKEEGTYVVMALVLKEDSAYCVLKDYFTAVSAKAMADDALKKQGPLPENTFDAWKTGLVLEQSALNASKKYIPEAGENALSSIKLVSGTNPDYYHSNPSEPQFTYEVAPAPGAEKFTWYVIPDMQSMLPTYDNKSGLYFQSYINRRISDYTVNGLKVYSLQKTLDPLPEKVARLPFPDKRGEIPETQRFKVICVEYDANGAELKKNIYYQYFKDYFGPTREKTDATLVKVQEQMSRMEKFRPLILGAIHPLNAVYINEDEGKAVPIQLFYGADRENPKKTRLLDLTIGADKSDFIGSDLEDALESMDWWESYPDGYIFVNFPGGRQKKMKTHGESIAHRFGTWSGWTSTLLIVGGAVASFFPATRAFAPALIDAGLTVGAVSSGLYLYDQFEKDKVDPMRVGVEILNLASIFVMKAGIGFSMLGAAAKSEKYLVRGMNLFLISSALDITGGILISMSAAAELDAILKDPAIDKAEKERRVAAATARLIASFAIILLNADNISALKKGLLKEATHAGKHQNRNSFGHKGTSGSSYLITGKNQYPDERLGNPPHFKNVKYLNETERAEFEVFVGDDGLLYRANGTLLDTQSMQTVFSDQGRAIYVMDESGRIYVNSQSFGTFHHSSFLAGKPIAAAGEIAIENGKVVYINAKSGHYIPTPWTTATDQFQGELMLRGAKTDDVVIEGGF